MPAHNTRHRYHNGAFEYFDRETYETFPVGSPLFSDDFFGSDVAFPAAASPESGCKWVKKIVGAAPPTVVGLADATGGVVECALTATSEKQNAELYLNDELQFLVTQGLQFEARFRPSVLPTGNAEIVVGVTSAWTDGLDAATYSLFATLDGSGEIFCEKDDNASDESATSGVTLTASDWAVLRIDCANVADVKFYINRQRVATATTFDWAATAANSKVQPIFGCYKASGTGVGTVLVDYVKVWQARA